MNGKFFDVTGERRNRAMLSFDYAGFENDV